MKYDNDDEHDDQDAHYDNEHHPPHTSDPLDRSLYADRVEEKVSEVVESSVIVHHHALVQKVAVAGEVFARESRANLDSASFHVW